MNERQKRCRSYMAGGQRSRYGAGSAMGGRARPAGGPGCASQRYSGTVLASGSRGKTEPEQTNEEPASAALPFRLRGFWEVRGGSRLNDVPHQRDLSIAETRLQLEAEKYLQGATVRLTGDVLYDDLADDRAVDLESGEGAFDLREASLVFSPSADTDVKLGRQILTWGTGDLVFINDLFPKDWVSFLSARCGVPQGALGRIEGFGFFRLGKS